MATAGSKKSQKGRKIGRNKGTEKAKRYERRYLTMEGMMGRKVRKLMRHNGMDEVSALRHWKANRKRGRR